jgi:hypothetical protein
MKGIGKPPAPSRARRILRRLGLVALTSLFIAVLASGWAYHQARAQVGEGLMDLGAQMMRFSQARRQDAPRDLMLNGQRIRFSSGTADRTAREVLDFFEARCADADGGLTEQVESLRQQRPDAFDGERSSSPVLREGDDRQGYVACLDFGQSIGVTELAERLVRFGETGNVADVGEMRFVFAEQNDEGATHFVAMWTTGSFDLNRMFPEQGDAPGRDIEGLARPDRARRILSSWEQGQPYTLSVYETREDEAVLERFYRNALDQAGWTILDPSRQPDPAAPRLLVAEHGERMVTVVFSTDLATGYASVAVIDGQ